MSQLIAFLANIDRRIIFVLMFFSVLIPFLIPFEMPIRAVQIVQNIYDKVEEVGTKKGTILISVDFDPASKAELEPVTRSFMAQAFKAGAKLVVMGHWPNGMGLAETILNESAAEFNKEYGKDYVFLGYKPGHAMLILNMGQDFRSAFPVDKKGQELKGMEITKNILTLKDFDYIFSLSAGSGGIDMWVTYAQSKYNVSLGGAATAVMAPDFFPYLQTGQLNGLIGGLTGAAQYEHLVGRPGAAIRGMRPQSVAHILLILLIVVGNICYFAQKREERKSRAQ